MAWQDRPYYRDRPSTGMSPLLWLLAGSMPLFRLFGINVRAHASLVILIALGLLMNLAEWELWATGLSMLFLCVLLHELGHCFATRAVGGSADEVLLWPLGGLAYTSPPHRPLPTFLSLAAGPATNLLLYFASAAALLWMQHFPAFIGFFDPSAGAAASHRAAFFVTVFADINLMLLFFNLLPIYPLDGGQMLQSILWPMIGYTRATIVSCWVGIGGACAMVLLGFWGGLWMVLIAISCVMTCLQRLASARATAAEGWEEQPSYLTTAPAPARRHHRQGRFGTWKARRQIRHDQAEQGRIDRILEKVSLHGMHSLSWLEKRALRKATERQRAREMEDARRQW